MTTEHLRTFAFIILWAIGAIVLANMLVKPIDGQVSGDPFRVVKTRVVDTGAEIAKRKDAFYDAGMNR